MSCSLRARVVAVDGIVSRRTADGIVFLDRRKEVFFSLNTSGTLIWDTLLASATVQEALESLHQVYDVDREVLRGDLEDFLHNLAEYGLIKFHEL